MTIPDISTWHILDPAVAVRLEGFLSRVSTLGEGVASFLRAHAPVFADVAKRLAQLQEWMSRVPTELRDALGGEMIPHPELALDDVRVVLDTFRASGPGAAVAALESLYAELFTAGRETIESRWKKSRRWPILREILQAHDAGLYFVAIPVALAQAEGIIADFMKHEGQMGGQKLKQHIHKILEEDSFSAPAIGAFTDLLMARFAHGQPVPDFSRHAILHGADIEYGTARKSLSVLVWLDYLLISEQERAEEPEDRVLTESCA